MQQVKNRINEAECEMVKEKKRIKEEQERIRKAKEIEDQRAN
jgi:hypothetical protein